MIALLAALELALQIAAAFTQWRFQRDASILQPGTVRILCLGDSNTYGLYLAPEHAWPSQLQRLLDARTPGRYQVINLGFPGTPSSRIVENLPTFLMQFQPDLVIMLVGVNDLLFGPINPSPQARSPGERLHAVAATHLRLYRLYRLWRQRLLPPPAVSNDFDAQYAEMRGLSALPRDAALRALAALYQSFAGHLPGFAVTAAGDDYVVSYRSASVPLGPALDALRQQEGFALTSAFLAPLLKLGVEFRDLRNQAKLRVGGRTFALQPTHTRGAGGSELVDRNIQQVAATVRAQDIDLLLLTYASGAQLYGAANALLRRTAERLALPLLDIEPRATAACRAPACADLLFPDGHPRAAGYQLVAAAVTEWLTTDRSAPSPPPPALQ
ncbi:MAG: SGNH/GDSL hydrolase family protein [Candidatus Binatia bacterium]